ncbi:MAG: SlyX family protein [Planctomycetota bacterium]
MSDPHAKTSAPRDEMHDGSVSRLIQMEEQLAIMQRLTEQLNEVVTEMSRQMTQRDRTIKALVAEVKALKANKDLGGPVVDAGDEKPPHY